MGLNDDGEIGDGTQTNRLVPTQVSGGSTWKQVSAGDWHNCGLKSDSTAWCWGYNGDGRLGTGKKTDAQLVPAPVAGGGTWKMIDSGYFYSCGVKTNGKAYCWGRNNYGRLGTGSLEKNETTPTPVAGNGDWVEVFAGGDHTCGLQTDGSGYCWGKNDKGQLGVKGPDSATPVKLPGKWKSVLANGKVSCGIKIDGTGWCWGSNVQGQVGNGNTIDQKTPVQIEGGGTWLQLSPGQFMSCGIKSDQSGWCWGTGYVNPIKFAGKWAEISTGDWDGCGIKTDGTAWCWWENANGEGGTGSIGYASKPKQVLGGNNWWA